MVEPRNGRGESKSRLYPTRSDLREEEFVLAYNFRRDISWREGMVPTA